MDKAETREALFGSEPEMVESKAPESNSWSGDKSRDIIDRVGPWGVINRRM
ncbi:DUF6638 family protein [Cognatiyoonia sp.]|uniref:DUF6638 family protein n=1 Tax=Cognatiyoonia sp. TaxID=2211652 RepID=UPI003F6A4739